MIRIRNTYATLSLVAFLALLVPTYTSGTTPPRNIIRHMQFNDEGANASSRITEEWYDGLGRPVSEIRKRFVPNMGHDIKDTILYDDYGRLIKRSLPTPVNAPSFYGVGEEPFSITEYDGSPLNRVAVEYGPGKSWHETGHAVRTSYLINTAVDSLACRRWQLSWQGDTTLTISSQGLCPSGQLDVVRVSDEDGNVVFRFINMKNSIVLERRLSRIVGGPTYADTYYIYDEFDRLAVVLPPALTARLLSSSVSSWTTGSESLIDKLAYLYRYDSFGRCIAQKLPGCGWHLMIYDRNNRIVFEQGPDQRQQSLWHYTIRDGRGRECLIGTLRDSSLNAFTHTSRVSPIRARRSENGIFGYEIEGYDISTYTVQRALWWDNYSFLGNLGIPSFGSSCVMRTVSLGFGSSVPVGDLPPHMTSTGLLTGEYNHVYGGQIADEYLWKVHYYDNEGRRVQTNSQKLLGVEKEEISYDFRSNPTLRRISHMTPAGSIFLQETYNYSYDDWGRLLRKDYTVFNRPPVCLEENTYDAVGRLSSRSRGVSGVLPESFCYDIRSRLDSISAGIGGGAFSQRMYYNTTHPKGGTSPKWNGVITAIDWQHAGMATGDRFIPRYDPLGRLQELDYLPASGNPISFDWVYDLNGNIIYAGESILTSSGQPMERSDLALFCDGNRLIGKSEYLIAYIDDPEIGELESLAHPSPGVQVLQEIVPGIDEDPGIEEELEMDHVLSYDSCGRLLSDSSRGILSIQYNDLSLPSMVSFSSASQKPPLYYRYSADGTKLEQGVIETGEFSYYSPHMTYEGNLVYVDGALDRVLFDGGYISAADSVFHFFVTDHLGSIRAIVSGNGAVEKTYDYKPFGGDLEFGVTSFPSQNPYKFGGKEWDAALQSYDYPARLYDSSVMRWTTMDPLCEKYYSLSPYSYCANNPINLVDSYGSDWYLFDEKGEYIRTVEKPGTHRLAMYHTEDNHITIRLYMFADAINDPIAIDIGIIRRIVVVSTDTIINALRGAGAFSDNMFGIINSHGGERYDYYSQQIADSNDKHTAMLYLPEGDCFVHNAMNYGNFLWGATGYTLGYGLLSLELFAQINSIVNSESNGYKSELDSVDDQLSIRLGVKFAARNHFRKIKRHEK